MPELPEVESLRRVLARSIVGRTIVSVRINEPRLRRAVAPDFPKLVSGRKIERLRRRAKYLIVDLSGGKSMLSHLGMSGSLTYRDKDFMTGQFNARHDHIHFQLDDGNAMVYNDPRRFGLLKLVPRADLESTPELSALGPEPVSNAFDAAYLARTIHGRKAAIKNLLMDQRVVAGIGNIYAAEILFRAGVRPTRRAGRLKRAEIERIVDATAPILNAAIDGRGTTFRSYRDSSGRPGDFVTRLKVYGRAGEPCYVCGTPIRTTTLGQRSSFYCLTCQR
ncbi:MAG TPA: bifunctional DNA-formamidopyrimidine glycosylase/DNA-(apurinic or apyrimidinic site) lyase [Candidatus Binataceae bacterium]|nr:bifunctional DNA-formamidopyrimidine glycosylase/DNA-(apurinic or apyrimidinic site) lyase [Candidatus Binataceae bacterium]